MVNNAALGSALTRLAGEQHLSRAVLVSRDREVVFEHAYGLASRQLDVPNVLTTRFHIAPMTKMFIAMAALVLSGQGRIACTR